MTKWKVSISSGHSRSCWTYSLVNNLRLNVVELTTLYFVCVDAINLLSNKGESLQIYMDWQSSLYCYKHCKAVYVR